MSVTLTTEKSGDNWFVSLTHVALTLEQTSYEIAKPQSYRVGDIVEVQVSFTVVPLRGQKYKMLSVMRSIALMNNKFTEVRR
jgi:hypothetical protein